MLRAVAASRSYRSGGQWPECSSGCLDSATARGIKSLVKRIYNYLTLSTANQAKRFRAGYFVITIRFEHLRYSKKSLIESEISCGTVNVEAR